MCGSGPDVYSTFNLIHSRKLIIPSCYHFHTLSTGLYTNFRSRRMTLKNLVPVITITTMRTLNVISTIKGGGNWTVRIGTGTRNQSVLWYKNAFVLTKSQIKRSSLWYLQPSKGNQGRENALWQILQLVIL